jgi:hypothetical protein
MTGMRSARLAVRGLALAFVFVAATAAPAAAHGTAQVPATDYAVRVTSISPRLPGVHVRAVDDGARLELRNDSGTEVTVLGYADPPEPYLRVGPDGVFRNQLSPAVYWNKQPAITDTPPRGYDATKPPRWHRVSHDNVVVWHDHRAHYLGAAPGNGQSRVVLRWSVPLRAGDRTVTLAGDVRYLPPPSPGPYLLLAGLLAVALVLGGRTRAWVAALAASLVLLLLGAGVQLVGEWHATTLSLASRIGEHVYVFAGLALGVGALIWLAIRRSRPYDATPIALLAGVALLLASGLTGLPLLTHAILPTRLPESFVRVLVATTIGAGIATIVIAATRLRSPYVRAGGGQESSTTTPIFRSMYVEK